MPRDAVLVRTISIAGLFIWVGLSACDRGQKPRSAEPAPNRISRATDTDDQWDSTEHPAQGIAPTVEVDRRPEPIFRPDDLRIPHDEKRLAEVGIHVFESKRLKLYTDVDPETARSLPALIDDLYLAWEDYFEPLPPDRAGTDFQISGFLMRDMALFRGLGLIPEELTFDHGSHRQNEFWMREQEFDYFRRHLLIHEATHCFMTFMPDVVAPRWYLEGMAEYFGAHRLAAENNPTDLQTRHTMLTQFRVMPTSTNDFTGFGRISIIRRDVAANKSRPIPSILALKSVEYVSPDPYAWSWALCAFLDGTPRYRDRFQKLGGFTQGGQFPRQFTRLFAPDERDLTSEWNLFVTNLQYGYDLERAAIDFQTGEPLTDEAPDRVVEIVADRGWQSSRVSLKHNAHYEVTAKGRFTLTVVDKDAKPWESEPQGISFRYFDGQPLGTLLGCLRSEEGSVGSTDDPMLKVIALGSGRRFQAPVTGTLYLRLNDAWNSLQDNQGQVTVTIRRLSIPSP